MNNLAKLPYKTKFQPEYEQLQQRIGKLTIPPASTSTYQISDQLIELFNNAKQKIRQQELQFTPSNIYTQYASPKQLNENKKKASQTCPGCGEEGKKQVQCQFCAVVYCKNCCSRRRVLPHLSDPKDAKNECQECHSKFVKLFANQKFYHQSNLLQKIVQSSNTKLKKIQKQALNKKQRFDAVEKKKKQSKIRQNMLLKQLKNQEKKIQDLQQKLQQVVKKKAQQLRQQQQKLEQEKRKQQEKQKQEASKIKQQQEKLEAQRKKQEAQAQRLERQRKMQQQIWEAQKRQKQIQAQKQQLKKKQEETEKQLKKQHLEMELLRQKQKQKDQKKKQQEQQFKKQQIQRIKKAQSQEDHRIEAQELKKLAQTMTNKSGSNLKQVSNAPITLTAPLTPTKNLANASAQVGSPLLVLSSPVENKQSVNSSYQHLEQKSPQKSTSSNNASPKQTNQHKSKNLAASNMSEDMVVTTSINVKGSHSEKVEQTEGTQKGNQNQDEDPKSKSHQTDNNDSDTVLAAFNAMPQIAINVSQMTIKQLVGFHVNPTAPQNQKRKSQIYGVEKQQRNSLTRPQLDKLRISIEQKDQNVQLTEQEKQSILRSSNLKPSVISSHHDQTEQLYEHPDPAGSKCNCNIM